MREGGSKGFGMEEGERGGQEEEEILKERRETG